MGGDISSTSIEVTLVLFCVGVIYQCGRLSARVESLEGWRAEVREDFTAMRRALDKIVERFVTHGAP